MVKNRHAYPKSRSLVIGPRWLGAAIVLLLHGLTAIVLLQHTYLKDTAPAQARPMLLLNLKPRTPAQTPPPLIIGAPKILASPPIYLAPPQFRVSPPDSVHPSPITAVPEVKAAPITPPPSGRKEFNDLFSADKKAQFKQFFAKQADDDRRENAKSGTASNPCDSFKKQNELAEAGQKESNGITRDFKPGLAFSMGGSTGDDATPHACN